MKVREIIWLVALLLLIGGVLCGYIYFPDGKYSMHANGKTGVVVAVISIIFAGIVLYLCSLDRRISKMEKEQRK